MISQYRKAVLALALWSAGACAADAGFVDVLSAPAEASALAPARLLNGVALADQRLVAVGQRGHILYSDDAARNWKQATVPVSADLTAVWFASPSKGWAVGHAGVVLATTDGGNTWTKQLDGKAAARLMSDHYARNPPPLQGEALAEFRADIERFVAEGPDKPFLDVWFESETTGYVVGLFNLIFRTDDGGRNWTPLYERTENPKRLHLYAIRPVDEDLYIVGEEGLVLRLDRTSGDFSRLPTPYRGTYFGVTGGPGAILVFGLRGSVFRSTDGGADWTKVETGVPVGLTASTILPDGRIVLASQAGHLLASSDAGATFAPLNLGPPIPVGGVVAAPGKIIVVGPRGVAAQPLP
jgi:photosystem II stability/assembly factor-like uncharacterized protein